MLFYLNILQKISCSAGFVPTFSNWGSFSRLPFQMLLLWLILLYFAFYSLPLIFSLALITLFSLWLLKNISCLHHSKLQNHLLKGKLIMVNGEMFSTNQTIYINPRGEMGKTPLINGDMVKDQLNISFWTSWIFLPIFTQLFPYFM